MLCSCGGRDPYVCSSSSQCIAGGVAGVCEPSGFCSFDDPSCPGGRKYDPSAGGGLGGTCVAVDAGVDPEGCIESVAYGRHFGCVLATGGTVWCVGANGRGQIGFGLAGASNVLAWMQVRDSTTSNPITDATAIGAGGEHACAVRTGGTVWCWGRGELGQIGNNATADATAAAQVRREIDDAPLANVVEIDGGFEHTCARDTSGEVWCWGANQHNQLGDTTTLQRNRAVAVLAGAVELSVGRDTTCARKANDEIWCWGRNPDGQIGDGSTGNKPAPTLAGSGKAVSAGGWAVCRIESGDTVACSGSPWRGRLGNGGANDTADQPTPAQVPVGRDGPALAGVVELALGGASCARLADGTVKCWSDNTHGVSGTGASAPYPRTVRRADGSPLDRVDRLWAGFSHVCARRDGAIECWGRGLSGEFGDGKLEDRGAATPLELACP